MPNTIKLISSVTVGAGGAGSISFSSIPSTYNDLHLVLSTRVTRATTHSTIVLTINGSSTSDYSQKGISGNGSTVSATQTSASTNLTYMETPAANATANAFGLHSIYFPNYKSTSNKSIIFDTASETNATTSYLNVNHGFWAYGTTISSLTLTEPNGGSNFAQYSTAYLYGISNS